MRWLPVLSGQHAVFRGGECSERAHSDSPTRSLWHACATQTVLPLRRIIAGDVARVDQHAQHGVLPFCRSAAYQIAVLRAVV